MRIRSSAPVRAAKTGYIVTSIALCLIGVLFIFFPHAGAMWLGTVCGIVLVVSGVIRIMGYFSRDLYRLAFQYDLEFGILLMIIGVLILLRGSGFMKLVSIILGIMVISDGLIKIRISRDAHRFGIARWWLILLLALVTCLAGAIMIFLPAEGSMLLSIWIGVSLLSEGIMNLIVAICTVKVVENQKADIIEGDYIENKGSE